MLHALHHQIVLQAKRWFYSGKGEPYRIGGRTLRYTPGSRPVRLCYKTSTNNNTRFDALQLEMLSNGIREGDTVVDIGAHCGQYSIVMAAFCGNSGRVVSFEPDPYARDFFKRNLDLNPTIKRPIIEEIALSDREGEAVLFSKGGNSQSSLVRSAVEFGDDYSSEAIRIRTDTLDAYLARTSLSSPSWVKIDAEGAEIRILTGSPKLLKGPTRILCELHPYAWEAFGSSLDELKAIVAASGRRMTILGTNQEVGKSVSYGTVLLDRTL